jgi:hypothetical protein
MFSLAHSRYTLVLQLTFLLANAAGLLTGVIYNHSTPDLYPSNSHHKLGWAITWLATGWVVMGLVNLYARAQTDSRQPISRAAMAQYERLQAAEDPQQHDTRWSNDSGQGTERNSESLFGENSQTPSLRSENQEFDEPRQQYQDNDDDFEEVDINARNDAEKRGFLRKSLRVDRFLSKNIPRIAFGRTTVVIRFLHALVERFLLQLGFVGIMTGLVVYGGVAVSHQNECCIH